MDPRTYWLEPQFSNNPASAVFVDNPPIRHLLGVHTGYDLKKVSGTTTAATASTLTDAATLTEDDDFWNGADCSVLVGTAYQSRKVLDFASGVLTLDSALTGSASLLSNADYVLRLKDTTNFAALDEENDLISIDYDTGIIETSSSSKRWVVSYHGGYETIPEPIKQAARILVTEEMNKEPAGVTALQMGSFNRTFYVDPTQRLHPRIKRLLEPYVLRDKRYRGI